MSSYRTTYIPLRTDAVFEYKEQGENVIGPVCSSDAAFQFRKTQSCKRLVAIVETPYFCSKNCTYIKEEARLKLLLMAVVCSVKAEDLFLFLRVTLSLLGSDGKTHLTP
jgi:hypothetical protein